jgi:FMN reductase
MAKIVAIAGSPSHPSRTYGIVEYALNLLAQNGFETDLISVRDLPSEDLIFGRYDSPALEPAKALIQAASGLIVATPVYKASYTGVLKSFLDLLPPKFLSGKVILPIATGGTIAHLLSIDYTLKPVLSELGAEYLLNGVYAVDKQIQRQENGSFLLDEEIEQRLQTSVQDLEQAVEQISNHAEKLILA